MYRAFLTTMLIAGLPVGQTAMKGNRAFHCQDNIQQTDLVRCSGKTEAAFHDAAQECAAKPPKTLFGIIRDLAKPESLRMISLMLAFGSSLEARSQHFAGGMSAPHQ